MDNANGTETSGTGSGIPDQDSPEWLDWATDRILTFTNLLVGHDLRPYQVPLARRIIRSVVENDAETITALAARQSGKSETLTNVVAALMVILPLLARVFPGRLAMFKDGLWVGIFAPVEEQANTLFGRIVDRLTSEHAQEILADPDIDDGIVGKARQIRFKRNGSRALMMTANPRAKIESKSFHLILIDEAQDCDDFVLNKSISPMVAAYAGTVVMTGTPTTRKGAFYAAIQRNKARALEKRNKLPCHYQWDWREVIKYNEAYKKFVLLEIEKIGEDSDAFQMSYNLKWLLEQGMFTTETRIDELGDVGMQELVKAWVRTPVCVGIDCARTQDSTVVTVVWVDWDRPDEFGMYEHRVLNWLELQNVNWEEQYFQILRFLEPYNIYAVAIDAQGVGDAVAERLSILLRRTHPSAEVHGLKSNINDQSKRWKHLMALIDRGKIAWPAGAKVRRLRSFQRFRHQMVNAEKHFQGPNMMVKAPEEANAHDDYPQSLALACWLTAEQSAPEVEIIDNVFFRSARRR